MIYFMSADASRPQLHTLEVIEVGRFVDKLSAITLAAAENRDLLVSMTDDEMRVIEQNARVFDFPWVVLVTSTGMPPYWSNLARLYETVPEPTLVEKDQAARADEQLRENKLPAGSKAGDHVPTSALRQDVRDNRSRRSYVKGMDGDASLQNSTSQKGADDAEQEGDEDGID